MKIPLDCLKTALKIQMDEKKAFAEQLTNLERSLRKLREDGISNEKAIAEITDAIALIENEEKEAPSEEKPEKEEPKKKEGAKK